jgi:hypothetical protein
VHAIISRKGKKENLGIRERFYIYKAAENNPTLNDQYAADLNVFFDIIINRVSKEA